MKQRILITTTAAGPVARVGLAHGCLSHCGAVTLTQRGIIRSVNKARQLATRTVLIGH
jgi:hypothetical protein